MFLVLFTWIGIIKGIFFTFAGIIKGKGISTSTSHPVKNVTKCPPLVRTLFGWQDCIICRGFKDLLNRFSSFKDNCFHKKKNFILIIVFFVSCKYLHWFLSYDENNNFAYSWTGPESPDSQTSIMLIWIC